MGFLKKVFSSIKSIVKGVGKAIKKVSKILWKPIKAVLKPIGKVFGKLGPLGTIALSFILPGIGGMLGSWFNAAGGAFQGLFAPGSFMHNAIGHIGTAIQNGAKWVGKAYNSTVGKVFDTVSNAITGGIDAITGGAASRFGEWTSGFMNKLSYKGEGLIPPMSEVVANPTLKDRIVDMANTVTDSIATSLESAILPQTAVPPPTIAADDKGFLKKAFDWGGEKIQAFKDIEVGGVGTVGDLQEAKGFYDKMTAEDPERQVGFNANIGLAGQMLPTLTSAIAPITLDLNQFSRPTDFMSLLNNYAGAFGALIPQGMNPVNFIQDLPTGYGWGFDDLPKQTGGGN